MTLYRRFPRPDGLTLERDALRVYMMCNGQRDLDEVVSLTRLSLAQVREALGWLECRALIAPLEPGGAAADAGPAQTASTQGTAAQAPTLKILEGVLRQHLGAAASPHIERLRACPDETALRLEVPRLVARLKLVVNRQVGEALERAYLSLPPL
ncbi:hypothetical protein SAMN04488058_10573 [Deinococcus reticulitermitis]|uniref:Uncharacterized protein n=1 Tax=Deinococcus reticulitermitis TaxID=856736 RepID=A0A1H6XFP5_9DEIO|nr:hypothetical protein [Deinococcus reticulitermitis]SEJ23700.1 hypothetical protein SAMN04488058_10573 [Deinococcus reticulitermitis]